MNQNNVRVMLEILPQLTLPKALVLAQAQMQFSAMPQYHSGRAKVLALTPEKVMDFIVANIPLNELRVEALMAQGRGPLTAAEIAAINEGLIVACAAVGIRGDLSVEEYTVLVEPWNMVLPLA